VRDLVLPVHQLLKCVIDVFLEEHLCELLLFDVLIGGKATVNMVDVLARLFDELLLSKILLHPCQLA
jgi:hypothetical protein